MAPGPALIYVKVPDRQMPMYTADGRFPEGGLRMMAKAAVDVHLLEAPPDVAKLYTEAFLK